MMSRQKGSVTLFAVIMIMATLVTLLGSLYIYVVNRARHHARIKQAYLIQNLMEQAAKRMRQNYDQTGDWRPSAPECGAPGQLGIEITAPDGVTKYCFVRDEKLSKDMGHIAYMAKDPESPSLNFLVRLDQFFDESKYQSDGTMKKPELFGWFGRHFLELKRAQASLIPMIPNCHLGDPECMCRTTISYTPPLSPGVCPAGMPSFNGYNLDTGLFASIQGPEVNGGCCETDGSMDGSCRSQNCAQIESLGGMNFYWFGPSTMAGGWNVLSTSSLISRCLSLSCPSGNLNAWDPGGMTCTGATASQNPCQISPGSQDCQKWRALKCIQCPAGDNACATVGIQLGSFNVSQSFRFLQPSDLQ